jgi:hypothetical protein
VKVYARVETDSPGISIRSAKTGEVLWGITLFGLRKLPGPHARIALVEKMLKAWMNRSEDA